MYRAQETPPTSRGKSRAGVARLGRFGGLTYFTYIPIVLVYKYIPAIHTDSVLRTYIPMEVHVPTLIELSYGCMYIYSSNSTEVLLRTYDARGPGTYVEYIRCNDTVLVCAPNCTVHSYGALHQGVKCNKQRKLVCCYRGSPPCVGRYVLYNIYSTYGGVTN